MAVAKDKLNDLGLSVGNVAGKDLKYLAYVRTCTRDNCPVFKSCTYNKRGKCSLEHTFLKNIYVSWVDPVHGLGDVLTQPQLHRLGNHVMPLYSIYIRLSKEMFALDALTYTDGKSQKRSYPQLKEIRETLKSINMELDKIGLDKLWEKKFGNKVMPADKSIPEVMNDADAEAMKYGNVNRYKNLKKDKEEKEKKANDDDS